MPKGPLKKISGDVSKNVGPVAKTVLTLILGLVVWTYVVKPFLDQRQADPSTEES